MIEFRDVEDREDLEKAWEVRHEVFVDEQKVPRGIEVDELDTAPRTAHVLVLDDGVPVATGRVIADDDGKVHIGRVAVRRRSRGAGLGAALMVRLEARALAEFGVAEESGRLRLAIELSSQEHAMPFYEKLGYSAVSGVRYLDAGIWHQDMARLIRL